MPYPGLLCPEPLPLQQATADPDLNTQTLKGRSGSVSAGSPDVHKALFEPSKCLWLGFDSKRDFTPPTVLLGLLLCPWTWVSFFGGIQHSPASGCSAASIKHIENSILKSRDITSLIKVQLVTAMVFPVVMYGCESWTIKKAEH